MNRIGKPDANEISIHDRELLFRLYEDDRRFSQHHESQRTQASSIIVAIVAGLLAIIGLDEKIDPQDTVLAFMNVLVGVFGCAFTWKQYERSRLHLNRAKAYLELALSAGVGPKVVEVKVEADRVTSKSFGWIHRIKLSSLWIALHASMSLIGIFVFWASVSADMPTNNTESVPTQNCPLIEVEQSGSTERDMVRAIETTGAKLSPSQEGDANRTPGK